MNTLQGLPILTHYNNLLKFQKQKDAWAVFHEFFDFFDGDSPKEHQWYLLIMSLTNSSDEMGAKQRSNLIFFFEYSLALIKAAEVLNNKRVTKGKRKK